MQIRGNEKGIIKKIKEYIRYEKDTGELFWIKNKGHGMAGMRIGTLNKRGGYLCFGFGKKRYQVHRIIWLLETGRWPKEYIDHINRNRQDNHFSNLREATIAQNNKNVQKRKDNTSGFLGVNWHKGRKKWVAQIGVNGKKVHLGYFNTPEEARKRREEAEKRYYKNFAPQ